MSGYFNAFHLKVMDLNLANVLCMHKPKYNYETKTRQNFSNYILTLFKTELSDYEILLPNQIRQKQGDFFSF